MNAYKTYHRSLEIFSGSLLKKRGEWQQVKNQLPAHTYLLVTPLNSSTQTHIIMKIGCALRKAGITVVVLSVG